MSHDLRPFLSDLTPDPAACEDARTFAALYSDTARVQARLEDVLLCLSSFHQGHAGQGLPPGLGAAVGALSFAASGLFALLEDRQGDTWGALTLARMWAVSKAARASADLAYSEAEDLRHAVHNPHLLPTWAAQVQAAGRVSEGGSYAAWYTVARLLEAAPSLEDGEAEDLLSAVLLALSETGAHFDLSGFAVFEGSGLIVRDVLALPGGRVRLEIQGGEGFDFHPKDARLYRAAGGGHVWASGPDFPRTCLEVPADLLPAVLAFLAFDEGPDTPPNLSLN